ncbi:hypothetical protein [Chryseobacterium gregarium]|uniref:hypothetical protein n=1 Tax=Chryseobacterium gregarium TaxID=456299 RepID=UPI0004241EE2|nr:hypothetical protein [Chryseobacterium gregarium]
MTTRALIIEYGTILESGTSSALSHLLGLKIGESKSFGMTSYALSFNNKFTLMSDLTVAEKDIQNKFQLFAEIRNKFAHIFEVNSYEKFCSINSEYKKKGEKLIDTYTKDIEGVEDMEEKDLEFVFQLCFIRLAQDLIKYLEDIIAKYQHDKGYEKGTHDTKEDLLNSFVLESSKTDEGRELLLKVVCEMKAKLNKD